MQIFLKLPNSYYIADAFNNYLITTAKTALFIGSFLFDADVSKRPPKAGARLTDCIYTNQQLKLKSTIKDKIKPYR